MTTSVAENTVAAPGIPTRAVIFDAAERVFGRNGYAGGSMREISIEADVAQALLHYHFKGGKDELYRAVFERRSSAIVEYRLGKLHELFGSSRSATLEDVLSIIMTPLNVIFNGVGQDSRHYLQMVAQVTLATDERSTAIMSMFYDPVGGEMVAALKRVLPELTDERATWAYLFTIGARLQAHAHNGRAARIMGKAASRSPHALLVHYAANGIRAIAALQEPNPPAPISAAAPGTLQSTAEAHPPRLRAPRRRKD